MFNLNIPKYCQTIPGLRINPARGYEEIRSENESQPEAIMAVVHAVCVSTKKGEKKIPVESIELKPDFGVVGDAHAGSGRQVSLLALDAVRRMQAKMASITPGDFAENVNVEGLEELCLAVGSRIKVGAGAVLEITQLGKECHSGCAIMRQVGACVMPKEGIFGKVVTGGTVRPGDLVTLA
jgi:MOSC domain-containing protein YiiM